MMVDNDVNMSKLKNDQIIKIIPNLSLAYPKNLNSHCSRVAPLSVASSSHVSIMGVLCHLTHRKVSMANCLPGVKVVLACQLT